MTQAAIIDWDYNAWGEKYPRFQADDAVPLYIAAELKLPVFQPNIVMEGGSIDVNGRGTLLTTEACLLNPNRNPELTRVAQNLWDRSYRYRVLALSTTENARRGLAQHRAILAALEARDPQQAVAAAEEHDQASIRHLRGRMQPGADDRQSGPVDGAVDPTHVGGPS